jgi:hypothetical protein
MSLTELQRKLFDNDGRPRAVAIRCCMAAVASNEHQRPMILNGVHLAELKGTRIILLARFEEEQHCRGLKADAAWTPDRDTLLAPPRPVRSAGVTERLLMRRGSFSRVCHSNSDSAARWPAISVVVQKRPEACAIQRPYNRSTHPRTDYR